MDIGNYTVAHCVGPNASDFAKPEKDKRTAKQVFSLCPTLADDERDSEKTSDFPLS